MKHIYLEAQSRYKELLEEHVRQTGTEREEALKKSLQELEEEVGDEIEYCYSVYNFDLFHAIAQDLNILGYAQEVEEEFGQGIASNPLLINEAIHRYMLAEYGDNKASDFGITE